MTVNDSVIEEYSNSLWNLPNLAVAPTMLTDMESEVTESHPALHDPSDMKDVILNAHEQQQQRRHSSPFHPQSSIPLGPTALALGRNEPAHKGAKRAPPPQQPKSKPRARRNSNKITTVSLKPKWKVTYRRTRFSGPTISTSPEPADDDSEYEDEPVGPSRKRRRRTLRHNKPIKDEEELQASFNLSPATVPVDQPNIIGGDSRSPSTIPVGNQNEPGPSATATTAVVEVGKKRERVTITQLNNGRWTCPRDNCFHTTDKAHDMGRHLETLAHRTKEFMCKRCGGTFTRGDALKRHAISRCQA